MRYMSRSLLLAGAGVLLAAASAAAQTPGKLGYVNTQAVLAQTPARQSAEEQFNRQMTPYNAEIARMDSTLKARITAFQRDSAAPVAQRQQREREIRDLQAQYQTRAEAIEDSAQAMRQRLVQPIMQQLEQALEAVRKDGGFAMIFDVAAGAPIVAADTTLDITQQVITRMKSMPAARTGSTPAAPAGPVAAPAGVGARRPPDR